MDINIRGGNMGQMNINGETLHVPPGASVSIVNGVVTINGVRVTVCPQAGHVGVSITGDVGDITVTRGSVHVTGNAGSVRADGSVTCGDVAGSVSAGGSVRASGRLGGSITAGGSVRIG